MRESFPIAALGNLVEITHEGQRVQGEIIRRDCNQISVQIRYPYDGLIERRTNKFIIYDPSQSHFSNFDYEVVIDGKAAAETDL